MNRLFVALLAAIFALPSLAAPPVWSLPDNMRWQRPQQDYTCATKPGSAGFILGCYFGPADTDYHTGVAFFRICDGRNEAHPFLVADFDLALVTVRYRAGYERSYPLLGDAIDPTSFYQQVNDSEGECSGVGMLL